MRPPAMTGHGVGDGHRAGEERIVEIPNLKDAGGRQPCLIWYAARNIRVALLTTCAIRSADGAGAAWKMNG